MIENAPNIYTGLESEGVRFKDGVEKNFNRGITIGLEQESLPQLNVDQLLVSLSENAIKNDKSKIRVLDFGSGRTGNFIFSFSEEKDFPEFHAFLKKHPEFKVEIVGFTAVNDVEQGKAIKSNDVEIGSPQQMRIDNHAYTVTRKHTVQKFIEQTKEPQDDQSFDSIFATWSLGYLTRTNFAQALEDLLNNLEPEGQLYCAQYHSVNPGFERTFFGSQLLNIPRDNKNEFLLDSYMVENMSPEDIKSTIQKQIRIILNLDSNLKEEIMETLSKYFTDKREINKENEKKSKLKNAMKNLAIWKIKKKFFRSEILETDEFLPIELFGKAYQWSSTTQSLNFIINREIFSKNSDHRDKKKLVEHIAKLAGFEVTISQQAFVITKHSNAMTVSNLVEEIRNSSEITSAQ